MAGEAAGCFEYLPSRAATARRALRHVPIADYGGYTFIDIGSGQGRMLFIAAEYSFRRIEGVELAAELHRQAEINIKRYRHRKQQCRQIGSRNVSAVDYVFPNENLLVYFFNPFGPAVMKAVLARLEQSLQENWRDVFVVLCYPELGPVLRASRYFQPVTENHRYCIFRSAAL